MQNPLISAIRGAICVEADEKELIDAAICKLYQEVLERNNLSESEVACLFITQTSDLKTRNPASGLRGSGFCATTPLFCMQELEIEGMLERVIRILIIANKPVEAVVPVFLGGAEKLRPDLTFLN